jgi:hypothetical protein
LHGALDDRRCYEKAKIGIRGRRHAARARGKKEASSESEKAGSGMKQDVLGLELSRSAIRTRTFRFTCRTAASTTNLGPTQATLASTGRFGYEICSDSFLGSVLLSSKPELFCRFFEERKAMVPVGRSPSSAACWDRSLNGSTRYELK